MSNRQESVPLHCITQWVIKTNGKPAIPNLNRRPGSFWQEDVNGQPPTHPFTHTQAQCIMHIFQFKEVIINLQVSCLSDTWHCLKARVHQQWCNVIYSSSVLGSILSHSILLYTSHHISEVTILTYLTFYSITHNLTNIVSNKNRSILL